MAPIPILHADEHLFVVDKPAGMLVVQAPGRRGTTLVDAVAQEQGCRIFAVHRLDEGTTGAMILARTEALRDAIDPLFRRHEIERDYLALVTGRPTPTAGRIESQLREVDGVMRVVEHGGQSAVTDYESLARRGRFTLVRCRLATGRRNQIRVHMQALGCPIAGDRTYGFRARGEESFARPLLHSWRVAFRHPLLGFQVQAEAAPPEPDLQP